MLGDTPDVPVNLEIHKRFSNEKHFPRDAIEKSFPFPPMADYYAELP
jgi:hypothetical protein